MMGSRGNLDEDLYEYRVWLLLLSTMHKEHVVAGFDLMILESKSKTLCIMSARWLLYFASQPYLLM